MLIKPLMCVIIIGFKKKKNAIKSTKLALDLNVKCVIQKIFSLLGECNFDIIYLFNLLIDDMITIWQANSHTWKWFDDSNGRWCKYSLSNNKTIDDAYQAGDVNVRFQAGRRRYTVHFNSMVQVMYWNSWNSSIHDAFNLDSSVW